MLNNLKIKDNNKLRISFKQDYYIFDFKYLTKNKKYNFKYFDKNKNDKLKAYDNLMEKIVDISNYSTENFNLLNKEKGLETISINQLNFKSNGLEMSDDDKFISIRFNSSNYRLICIKSIHYKNVLHIIGFDFNHSAYKH